MKRLFGKEVKVEKYSKLHAELVYECVYKLKEAMEHFYENKFDLLTDEVNEISRLEHEADEIRRRMEIEFYKGAFLPFDREDRIILAELVDDVADMTQETAYTICLGNIKFPISFKEDFSKLIEMAFEAVTVLKECIEMLDVDLKVALSKAHEVEKKEEVVDKIERKILKKLYESYRNEEFGILTFIELKDITQKIGNIADRAEDASDRVPIMAAKRRG